MQNLIKCLILMILVLNNIYLIYYNHMQFSICIKYTITHITIFFIFLYNNCLIFFLIMIPLKTVAFVQWNVAVFTSEICSAQFFFTCTNSALSQGFFTLTAAHCIYQFMLPEICQFSGMIKSGCGSYGFGIRQILPLFFSFALFYQ